MREREDKQGAKRHYRDSGGEVERSIGSSSGVRTDDIEGALAEGLSHGVEEHQDQIRLARCMSAR